jgi:hypothetical protein
VTDNPTFDKIKIDYRICDNKNGAKAMTKCSNKESIFLNEHLMAVVCVSSVITGAASLFLLSLQENNYLAIFGLVIKLITTATMFFAFRHYNWDVTKGLMGGVFFSLMYEEAYLVLGKLWSEQDFDVYLTNTNRLLDAGLDPLKFLIREDAQDNMFANVIAVNSETYDKEVFDKLVATLQSDEMRDWINENYKGAVLPAF